MKRTPSCINYTISADGDTDEDEALLSAVALSVMAVTPTAAGFAGTESRGQPINSTVYVPAIDPDTGVHAWSLQWLSLPLLPGYYSRANVKAKKVKKKKRVY